ncbi:MAG: glycosyl hydrolase 53 family protein [Oscillospiraceae bacterium]|nr:glycosyl hydrolase 53 family protein [Oscillospiraceae bacterium]
MGRFKQLAAVIAALTLGLNGTVQTAQPAYAAESVMYSGISGLPFDNGDPFKGVDLSSVISLENSGVKYRDRQGNEQDIFRTLADAGVNTIRVRIWNDPYQTGTGANYGGGVCDPDDAVQIANRCAAAGLSMLIDFHYSDFWADPGKQKAPKAWASYSVQQKADAIYQFTLETLRKISETGADIAMVQVGNETTTGMCGVLLDQYNWSDEGWRLLCSLFNAGAKAVREFSSKTLVALHFTNPEKTSNMNYLAKMLAQNNVDYDVFATSYYPYWHGTLSNLTNVLTSISQTYHKKVVVAETSWLHTLDESDGFQNTINTRDKLGEYVSYDISADGQSAFLHDLFRAVAAVPDGMGIGVFYWEPAWLPVGGKDFDRNLPVWEQYGSGWANKAAGEFDDSAAKYYGGSCIENEALFDLDGKPLDSLYVFGTVHGDGKQTAPKGKNLLANAGFEADGDWTDHPAGWTLNSTSGGHFDVRAEDARSGGYALHWYSESAFQNSTAETKITADQDGVCRCAVNVQADETSRYEIAVRSSGGFSKTESGAGSGWAVWTRPEIEFPVKKGETVTLTISVSGDAGCYGSVDDCEITIMQQTAEDPPKKEPVFGDLNSDGKTDGADVRLLLDYLTGGGSLTAEQAAQADCNKNGALDAADLTMMKQHILK